MKRLSVCLYGGTFFVAYVISLVMLFPASECFSLLKSKTSIERYKPIVSGVSGYWYRGQIKKGVFQKLYFQDLAWVTTPKRLLFGALGFDITGQLFSEPFQGHVSFDTDDISFEPLNLSLTASKLNEIAPSIPFSLLGMIHAQLDGISFHNKKMRFIEGTLSWENARIRLSSIIDLGDFEATLSTKKDAFLVHLQDKAGPVETNCQIVLRPEGTYTVSGRFRSRKSATKQINDLLALLGSPEPDGFRTQRFSGKTKDLPFLQGKTE